MSEYGSTIYKDSKAALLSPLSLALQLNYLEYQKGGNHRILQSERTDMVLLYDSFCPVSDIGTWIEKLGDCGI